MRQKRTRQKLTLDTCLINTTTIVIYASKGTRLRLKHLFTPLNCDRRMVLALGFITAKLFSSSNHILMHILKTFMVWTFLH